MKVTVIVVAAAAILSGGMLSALAHDLPTQKPVNLPAQKPVNLPAQKKVIPYNPRYDHYVRMRKVECDCFLLFCAPRAFEHHHYYVQAANYRPRYVQVRHYDHDEDDDD